MRPAPRALVAKAALCTVVALTTACGSGSTEAPPKQVGAEPSVAPTPSTTPAGRIIDLPAGSRPEGVAEDPVTHTVAISLRDPDRLALVDTRTLKARIIAAPGEGRHLILTRPGGPVLLPSEDRNTVYELALPSGRVIRSTHVLDHPHNAAVVGRDVWVADEFAPAVTVINARGRVIKNLRGPQQPGGVEAAAGTVGATDVLGARMYFYNATTFAAEGSIALGSGPTHGVAIGGPYVVSADTRGGALLVVDMSQRRIVGRLALPGGPYGLAVDSARHLMWVTLTEFNQVIELSTMHHRLRVIAKIPTVQQPNTVAVDPHSLCLYVAGVTQAQLEVICPH